jgi:hypothetical protein
MEMSNKRPRHYSVWDVCYVLITTNMETGRNFGIISGKCSVVGMCIIVEIIDRYGSLTYIVING